MGLLYINNNGTILKNKGSVLSAANRGHLYGDGLFESIRMINGKVINLEAHILRMFDGAIALKMELPEDYSVEFFEDKVNELLKLSILKKDARIRISLDRSTGGTYMPTSNLATFFIEVYPLEESGFELNEEGWEVDLYTEMRKHKNKLSGFKTKNGLIYVMASLAAQEKGMDDLLVTNTRGGILEGSSSNLFLVSNGVLYTSGIDEGCVGGVMRMAIINLALENNIKVYECSILPQNILAADEVFLTNAVKGITWVKKYRNKMYTNEFTKQLLNSINEKYL